MSGHAFPTTRWTLVSAARLPAETRRRALQELLQIYWPPLVVYLQHRGASLPDAQDIVQDLFAELLNGDFVQRLDPARGRLRGFLKVAAKHHLARRREREGAQKRGGKRIVVPLDAALCERVTDPSADDAEAAYDRRWAARVLDRALDRLVAQAGDRAALLRTFFGGGLAPSYRDAAASAGMSVPQLKSFLHRSRLRYRALLLEEVADTLVDPTEAGDELAALLASLDP